MDPKYNIFVFDTVVPMTISKGVIYITPYGEDYVNIFRSIQQYEENTGDIEESEDVKNVFVDRGIYTSAVDFRVNNPTLPRESLFIKSDLSIVKILKSIKDNRIVNGHDIFSAKSTLGYSDEQVDDIEKHVKIFFYIMLQFMNAGYHKGKNLRKVPDWCLCFSEPIMKYFIHYFEIPTEAPDIGIVDQFLTTPQFREMITIQMMKFMANYVINNEIIEPNKVESWYDIKLWLSIKNEF